MGSILGFFSLRSSTFRENLRYTLKTGVDGLVPGFPNHSDTLNRDPVFILAFEWDVQHQIILLQLKNLFNRRVLNAKSIS